MQCSHTDATGAALLESIWQYPEADDQPVTLAGYRCRYCGERFRRWPREIPLQEAAHAMTPEEIDADYMRIYGRGRRDPDQIERWEKSAGEPPRLSFP